MHHNESAFVAEHVAVEMLKRGMVAKGVAQSRLGVKPSKACKRGRPTYDLAPSLGKWIAREIHAGRRAWEASSDSVRSLKISEGIALLKDRIRQLVPPTFGWWMEVDHDLSFAVRWMWLGHPAVTRSGAVSDCDVTIMLALLKDVDWDGEARLAMVGVEEAESDLLRGAQERRRQTLTNPAQALALPPVEIPVMHAVSFEQKKTMLGPKEKPKARATAEEVEERVQRAKDSDPRTERKAKRASETARLEQSMQGYLEEKRNRPAQSAAASPTSEPASAAEKSHVLDADKKLEPQATEIGVAWIGDPRRFQARNGERPSFFLSCEAATCQLCETAWIPVQDVRGVLALIMSRPMGTFRQVWGYDGMVWMKTAEAVWKMTGRPVPENWRYRAPRTLRSDASTPPTPRPSAAHEPEQNNPDWFRRN